MSASGIKKETHDFSENISSKKTQQVLPSSICLLASSIVLGVSKTFTSDQVQNVHVALGHWEAKLLQPEPALSVLASAVPVGHKECYK